MTSIVAVTGRRSVVGSPVVDVHDSDLTGGGAAQET